MKKLLAICDLDIDSGARLTGIRNRAMLLLFIDSGVRRAEMANMKLSDVDLDGRRVRILGKGNKIGIAPFSPRTAKALWDWLLLRKTRATNDRLWVTEEGQAFSVEGLVSWFARLKKRAGVNSGISVQYSCQVNKALPDADAGKPFTIDGFYPGGYLGQGIPDQHRPHYGQIMKIVEHNIPAETVVDGRDKGHLTRNILERGYAGKKSSNGSDNQQSQPDGRSKGNR